MSHALKGFPPGGESVRGGAAPSGSANPRWWGVAAAAVLVSVALVAWLVVTSGSPGVAPTDPVSSTVGSSVEPTRVDSSDLEDVDWGGFPPKDVDSLKDLSDPVFPKMVGSFALDRESRDDFSVYTGYRDAKAFISMTGDVSFDRASYRVMIDGMLEPAYVGRAVCGVTDEGGGPGVLCVMSGKNETLTVGTGSEKLGVDEVAAFAEELYDSF